MASNRYIGTVLVGACAAALSVCAFTSLRAQPPQGQAGAPGAQAGRGGGGGGGGRGGSALNVFNAADSNKDGAVSREELKAAFAAWLAAGDNGGAGSVTQEQLATALNAAFPQPAAPAGGGFGGGGGGGGGRAQNQTPNPADVERMMAALPEKAPAKPKQPRKVLVLSKCAGFVHSCIPLVAKTIEAMGTKTGAWTTTVSYDSAVITAENLKQYDLLFLNNTTGAFLDDPANPTVTEERKKALLDFVRSGKGISGIHAAGDNYHRTEAAPEAAATAAAGRGAGGGGGRGFGAGTQLATQMVTAADKNNDKKVSREELSALADDWYDKLDTEKSGKVSQPNFAARFASVLPSNPTPAMPAGGAGGGARAGRPGPDREVGTWPEFNKLIGGFFKYHWMDPQHITVKIDDPKSPITAMFHGEEFDINDETYTFGINSWSRENVHVLTSIDYAKMSEADKLKEDYPRADHDYGLSWIRREGKGRVFYEAHGHNEKVYAIRLMLEHVLAGTQYAMGDLKANDAPSAKPKK